MAALTSTLAARQTIMLVPGPRRIGPDPVLEARGVSRRFRAGSGSFQAVWVTLAPGHLVAVTGPPNSGKSTLLTCLAGLDVANEGTILVEGTDLSRVTAQVRARVRARARSIGVMFQSGNLLSH
jgi:putative ABC transport system ATP-binding protein